MLEKTLLMYPKQVREFLGVSQPTFIEMYKSPGFPRARYPTGKRAMYLRDEIEIWVKNLGGDK